MFGITFGKKPAPVAKVSVATQTETPKPVAQSSTWNKKTVAYVGGSLATVALLVAGYVFKDALFGLAPPPVG